jgi:hypothetical protein
VRRSGLTIAYHAYRASLGGKAAPVIDGLTGDQRFFLAWAQIWRLKYRDAALKRRLLTNAHARAAQRVSTVRNRDAWVRAFFALMPAMRSTCRFPDGPISGELRTAMHAPSDPAARAAAKVEA